MVDDLRDLLRESAADPVGELDLDDVRHRARRVRRNQRLASSLPVVALMVVVAVLGWSAWKIFGPDRGVVIDQPSPQPEDPASETVRQERETGWRTMADSPLSPRYDHSAVWTGSEILVWGGYVRVDPGESGVLEPTTDGAAYDPQSGKWRTLPDSLLAPRSMHSAVWTGREMVVWGGRQEEADGAAYDPATDTWRSIAPGPLGPRWGHMAVWTGSEMIVYGGGHQPPEYADPTPVEGGAAYDPGSDEWRLLPDSPLGPRASAVAVWTGEKVIIGGGSSGDGRLPEQAAWAAYDPASDSWERLPDPPVVASLSPRGVWTGEEVIFYNGTGQARDGAEGAAYNPRSGTWRTIADAPLPKRLLNFELAWVPGRNVMVLWGGGVEGAPGNAGATYDPETDSWAGLPDSGLEPRSGHSLVGAGDRVIVWGGFTDGAQLNDGAIYRHPSGTQARDSGPDDAAPPQAVTLSALGRPLLLSGESGVRRVDGDHEERLWDGPVRDAIPDLLGGIVIQEASQSADGQDVASGFGTVRWLPEGAGGPEQIIVDPSDNPILHAVVEMDAEPTVLFTRRTGDLEGENQEERLYAHGLITGNVTDLGVTGRYDSGLGGAAIVDRRLVVSRCHTQCGLWIVSSTKDTDDLLLEPAAAHYGLDAVGDSVAFVQLSPSDVPDRSRASLVLQKISGGTPRTLHLAVLQTTPQSVSLHGGDLTRAVDLAPNGSAAIVQLDTYDHETDSWEHVKLFVDGLDGDPDVFRIDTSEQVRFDLPTGDADRFASAEDRQLVADFLRFAARPGSDTAAVLPFSEEVELGLASELLTSRSTAELGDAAAWVLDVEHFRGRTGPFSAVDVAADATETVVSVGDHPHCASPPVPAPARVADLRRVSIQPSPDSMDSCLQWWTVDLFLTDGHRIAAVTLDLWEP